MEGVDRIVAPRRARTLTMLLLRRGVRRVKIGLAAPHRASAQAVSEGQEVHVLKEARNKQDEARKRELPPAPEGAPAEKSSRTDEQD